VFARSLEGYQTASHLSEIAAFLGEHIVPYLFIHTTHYERVICISFGHITLALAWVSVQDLHVLFGFLLAIADIIAEFDKVLWN